MASCRGNSGFMKNPIAMPSPVGKTIFFSLAFAKASHNPISLLRISILSICFFTDSEGLDRPTMSMKKKFTFTTCDGKPVSEMLEPYRAASLLYVSIHVMLSNGNSESNIGVPIIGFPHIVQFNEIVD